MSTRERGKARDADYPWQDAYDALCQSIKVEALALEKQVADDDFPCPARALCRERAAALRHVLAIADALKRWEW